MPLLKEKADLCFLLKEHLKMNKSETKILKKSRELSFNSFLYIKQQQHRAGVLLSSRFYCESFESGAFVSVFSLVTVKTLRRDKQIIIF